MDKCIIHSDLNCFYASVECHKRPELANMPVVVCGTPSLRHGIVLAKNEKAKQCGISTGDTMQECSVKGNNIVRVHTDYSDYIQFSKKVYSIYRRYSDYIENFGIDECWIDITDIQGKDHGVTVSREIMDTITKETGLTVSVGISHNKTFSKLGSHLANANEIIHIPKDDFKKIWNIPVQHLIYSGRATTAKLNKLNIYTIGDLAKANKNDICKVLGVNGIALIERANGIDDTPVNHYSTKSIHKSISSCITMPIDLTADEQVSHLIFCLTEELTYRMRKYNYHGTGVQISIKNSNLKTNRYKAHLPFETCSTELISRTAIKLYKTNASEHNYIRALTVTVDGITHKKLQLNMTATNSMKSELLEHTIDNINQKFNSGVFRASKLELTPITDYFSKHSGLHKVAFSHNVNKIE